jgi:hypothetical protein
MENRGALPKDHELGEKKKEKEQSSFYRRGLCLLTCLLMGDPPFYSPLGVPRKRKIPNNQSLTPLAFGKL